MENHSERLVVELDMRPVIRFATLALHSEAGVDGLRQSKQLHCLIDQMRTKIEPEPGAGARLFAPSLAHVWSKAVDVRFKVANLPQHARFHDCLRRQNLTIPAAIVKYRK